MDFLSARTYVLDRLQQELPVELYYHGIHHTLDVCAVIEELARQENVVGEALVLLRTAALYHDLGFVEQYLNNEPVAVRIAQKTLPRFGYLPRQIEVISNIILATRIPQKPVSQLEKIMCDADLDYLGRDDFFEIAATLCKEWKAFGLISSAREWNEKQIAFFEQHQYFTRSAKAKRNKRKQENLATILQSCSA